LVTGTFLLNQTVHCARKIKVLYFIYVHHQPVICNFSVLCVLFFYIALLMWGICYKFIRNVFPSYIFFRSITNENLFNRKMSLMHWQPALYKTACDCMSILHSITDKKMQLSADFPCLSRFVFSPSMMGEMISGMLCKGESKFTLYSKESFSFLVVV